MSIAISTRGLTRRYGAVVALDDVTIDIREHTITGLLGRNGAGKTTLMSLITAQDRESEGTVRVLGHAPFEHEGTLEQMCFLRDNQRYPDDYKLHHAIRAASIFYPNWDQAFADELIELFRIPTKPVIKKLSRGQFSAVGIVIGLASRAPVTFFDEPYLGLDATARGHFYDALLRDYAAHPRTVILSTHLIDEMDRLLERVIILDRGRVVQDAEVDELRGLAFQAAGAAAALDRFTANLSVLSRHAIGGLGSAVIEGTVTRELRERAEADGLELSPVSLQSLVAAYGFNGSETADADRAQATQTPTGA
ncbi:ABC transporter ATP-binding protein [Leucobacter sp. M11]|uniref:ABC transporter ATP-binding protein n=1 Tax=Leucobacter sp. M11 TaxID=2993565 RepID=UPI002D7F18D8|nr:ABC transporter ATP-binding protein [Leucobacter sp. M11]MEB4614776.1 ABC transporter ATP-binding protein [Leucobacter sp. M11]